MVVQEATQMTVVVVPLLRRQITNMWKNAESLLSTVLD